MKIGASNITAMYLGSTAITAAYLGGVQVFGDDDDDEFADLMTTLLSGASQLIAHPLDYGSMFIDRAGTTPVTEPGQQVGRVLDVGGGNFHATAISDAARGIYREVGGLKYIEYNGVNTAYETPVLPAPGVNKAQLFAGVRKLSDAGAIVVELSPDAGSNLGVFYVVSGHNIDSQYSSLGRGGGGDRALQIAKITDFFAPDTCVLTATHDISPPLSRLRRNGVFGTDATDTKGSGDFNPSGAHPLYYGARGGATIFFNGHHYGTLGPIVRFGTNATEDQIAAAEAYYTTETGL